MSHRFHLGPWPDTREAAIALQRQLQERVILQDQMGQVVHVAGVDVGFESGGSITRAAVAVLTFPELVLVDRAIARCPTTFPYIPGLLSFRELPAVIDALNRLTILPQLLLCDGQGLAHPRRLGIACHLGLLTDIPAIGVAKSRLVGNHDPAPEPKGGWTLLTHREETIGAVLRTRQGTKPLFISSGHRISLATAIDYVMRCTTRYRLPETTRHAHKLASGPPLETLPPLQSSLPGF
ncbi:MAG: deoxyribonuclease V [Cyanobacteria bacterium P01_A01_bin.135]